jgi:hypothetical protein
MLCVDFLIVGEEVGQRTHGVEEDGLHLFFLVFLAPIPLSREVLDSQTLDEQVIEKQVLVLELVECTYHYIMWCTIILAQLGFMHFHDAPDATPGTELLGCHLEVVVGYHFVECSNLRLIASQVGEQCKQLLFSEPLPESKYLLDSLPQLNLCFIVGSSIEQINQIQQKHDDLLVIRCVLIFPQVIIHHQGMVLEESPKQRIADQR